MTNKGKMTAYQICMCAVFTVLICIGGMYLKIVIPNVVTWSFQYEVTMLAGLLLGGKLGSLSVIIYIAMGLIGLPVFTEGGGLMYALKPTFGYMIGFIIGTFITGTIANKEFNPSIKRLLAANFSGMLAVYAIGVPYYMAAIAFWVPDGVLNVGSVLYALVLLPLPKDIVCCVLAAFLGKKLLPKLPDRQRLTGGRKKSKETSENGEEIKE